MISITSGPCPIDFSDGSRGALRYANTVAAHLGARLALLAVNDPLLAEAASLSTVGSHLVSDTTREMQRFYKQAIGPRAIAGVEFEVASGKPAAEILRVSRARNSGLIVMASHGSSGFRKLFFGSTAERVLRETTVPTLVTSGADAGPADVDDIKKVVRRIVVPLDLTPATPHQLSIARAVAQRLDVPLLLVHVIEPVRPLSGHHDVHTVETERRYRVETELDRLNAAVGRGHRAGGAHCVWRTRRGNRESRQRSRRRANHHGSALVAAARPADGFGHLSRAVSGASAGAGAAAAAGCRRAYSIRPEPCARTANVSLRRRPIGAGTSQVPGG